MTVWGRLGKAVGACVSIFVLSCIVSLSFGQTKVSALTHVVSGTVTNANTSAPVSNVGVFVYAPGTNNSVYSTSTNGVGVYSLPSVEAGTYDLRFMPPSSTGLNNVVDKNVSVGGSLTHNKQLTSEKYTFSGTLTDPSGAPQSVSVSLRDFYGSTYSVAAGTGGSFSLAVHPDVYSMRVFSLGFFSIEQSVSTPTIDLTTSNLARNIVVPLATINFVSYNQQGYPNTGRSVTVRAPSATIPASLYPGDPGQYLVSVSNNTFTSNSPNGTGSFKSIIGITYVGAGINNGICNYTTGGASNPDPNTLIGCNTTPFTVAGGTNNVNIPETPAAPHVFSGNVVDLNGNGLSSVFFTFRDIFGNGVSGSTDANGHFNVALQPGMYSIFSIQRSINGVRHFLLQQDIANPTLDLTNADLTQNLVVPLATVNYVAYNAQGYPNAGRVVTARHSSNNPPPISLYPGDPGYISVTADSGTLGINTQGGGSFQTLVGLVYTNSICTYTTSDTSQLLGCNTTPFTVASSSSTVHVPQLPAAPHTFSGSLTDQNGNGFSGVTITLRDAFNNVVTGTTGSGGAFSLSVQPGLYSVRLTGSITGLGTFTLQQDIAHPALDLTAGNVIQSLQIPIATVNYAAYNAQGYPNANKIVRAIIGGAFLPLTLYSGDPGYTLTINSSNLSSDSQGTGSFKSIVGVTYTGANTSNCVSTYASGTSELIGCNTTPFTVVDGANNIDVPHAPASPRMFSGVLTDQQGNGFSGVTITLRDAFSNVVTGITGSGGAFSLTVQPGLYSMTLSGSIAGLGSFTLQQNTATPTVDLTGGDIVRNLQIPLATVGYTAYNAQGYRNANNFVRVQINNAPLALSLYPGDPGYTVSTFIGVLANSQGTGSFKAIVGVTYPGGSNPSNAICTYASSNAQNLIGCNTTPFTVTSGPNYIDIPQTPAASRTFSGTFSASDGSPISATTLTLQDAFNNIITTATGADGSFSLTVQPGVFSLRIVGGINGLGFTLQQNTATPTIDLTGGSVVRNLVVPVAIVDFMTLTTSSTPLINAKVFHRVSTTTVYPVPFYPGDPGYLVTTLSSSIPLSDTQARGSFKTLVGLTYGTTTNNGICENTSANVFVACISSPVTMVSGINNVVIPQAPAMGPAAPTGLSAASPASSPVLSWQAVSGALFYRVYRDGSQIGSTSGLTFTDNNVAGGEHSYYVTAVNNIGGASDPSGSASVTVVLEPPILPPTFSILPSPINTSQTATVSIPVLGNLYGFLGGEYFVGADPGQGNGIAMVFSNGTLSAPIGGLLPANHTVSVRALNGVGWSNVVSRVLNVATLPPTNLTAESPTHLVVLTWDSVEYASGYDIYRNGGKIATSATNTFTDLGAPIATNTYFVKALNPDGYPSNSSNVIGVVYEGPLHTVSGQVMFDGTLAPGVLVDVNTVEGPSDFGITDQNGVYSANNLEDGNYSVTVSNPLPLGTTTVSSPGAPNRFMLTSGFPFVVVSGGDVTQNLSFDTSAVTITVRNGQGLLLNNSLVSITNATDGLVNDTEGHVFNLSEGSLESFGYTIADGTVVLYVFPGATYQICGSFPRLNSMSSNQPYCMPLTLTVNGDTSYEVILPASYSASGHLSFGGTDVLQGGGKVIIKSADGSIQQVVLSDAGGNYNVEYLPDGVYDIQFVNNGSGPGGNIPQNWNFAKDAAITINGASVTQDLEFATNLVQVTVVDETGEVVATAFVYLKSKSGDPIATLDGTQTFDFAVNTIVASGTATGGQKTLGVFTGQMYEACAVVNTITYCNPTYLLVDSDTSVVVVAAETHSVGGTVLINGAPVPGSGANVWLIDKYTERDLTDPSGSYTVQNLVNGSYTTILSYSGAGYSSVATGLPDSFTLTSSQKYAVVNGGNAIHDLAFGTYPVVVNVFDELNSLLAGSQILATNSGSGLVLTSDGSMLFSVSSLQARAVSVTDGSAALYLFPGATYRVCATVNSGQYCATVIVSSTSANIVNIFTAAPNGLNVAAITPYPQNPVLSWSAVASAVSYNIYRGGDLVGASATTSFADTSVTEGIYVYQVQAVYPNGVEGALSASKSTVVDRTAPVLVSIAWVNNPSLFNSTVPIVTASLTDNLTDIVGGEYFIGDTDPGIGQGIGMAAPGMTATTSFAWVDYPPGTYLVTMRGRDAAGIWSNALTTTLVVEHPAPENLTAESPTYVYPVINWSPVAGSQYYTVYRDGADGGSSLTTSYTDEDANPGINVYTVVAISLLGVQSAHSNPVSVLYDPYPPTITPVFSQEPVNGWNNSPVTISFVCEAVYGVASCPEPAIISDDGANQQVTVTATDNLGGSTTITVTVNLDRAASTVGVPLLSANPIYPGQTTTVSASASDNLSGVAGGEYFIDIDPGEGNGTPLLWDGTNLTASFGSTLAPGTYTISVRSQDVAGNWSDVATITLTIILAAPTDLVAASPTQLPALTWTGSEGAVSYNVYRNVSLTGFAAGTSFTDNNAPDGTHSYFVTAVDINSNESQPSNTILVLVNTVPPTTTASLSPEPYAQDGAYPDPVTITLSASAVSGLSIVATYYTLDGGTQQTYTSPFTVSDPGSHVVAYWSVDNASVVEEANTLTFTIHTNLAPAINPVADATINEGSSFSANGSFDDYDSASWTATVDYGDGSGAQPLALGGTSFSLSHVYADDGTYTVTVVVTDNQGETSTATATVNVDNVAPSVGEITGIALEPIPLDGSGNASVTASITFTDPGILDTHTVVWDWGDGTTSTGVVTESNGAGSATGSHVYTTPGLYLVTVTVTDNGGLSAVQYFRYVAVYDDDSMFTAVTKFSSPAGAYIADPQLTGQVDFSVHVRYDSGGSLVGTVSMDFDAGNIHFASTGLVMLVCTELGRATLTGVGSLNGIGGYTFFVTGIDKNAANGNKIRFQIVDPEGNVVYDTQPGADITVVPTTQVVGTVMVKN